MNLEKIFSDFLVHESLVERKILLCVSGGVDSMVLLEVASKLCQIQNLAVFHLDHGLRKDSHKDFLFVQKMCSKKGVSFFGETLTHIPSKNKEASWRDERKKRSSIVAQKFNAQRILTAHHATDLVETMIFRLTKGVGISGLSPFHISTKPFWSVPKSEIIHYATCHKVAFQKDVSNENEDFERNLIRHKVVPALRTITPNLEKVFVTESEIFRETAGFLEAELQMHFEAQSMPLPAFVQLHIILQKEFLRRIAHKIPSSSETDDCLKWLNNHPKGNSVKTIGGTKLILKQNKIYWN